MTQMQLMKRRLNLLRGLIHGERSFSGPDWVALDITRKCNNICLGCFFHCVQERELSPGDQQIRELSIELAQKLSRELAALHTPEIVLVGEGEPLLHPDFFSIVASFKQADLQVQAFTNGTLIDEKIAEKIVSSGLDIINVTFWAINAAEHEKWHPGIPLDYLTRRSKAVELLKQAKIRAKTKHPFIRMQMPLTRYNYKNIIPRAKLACSLGCDAVVFGYFRDWEGRFSDLCLLPGDIEKIRDDLQAVKKILRSCNIKQNIKQYLAHALLGPEAWSKTPCYTGWYESYVKVDGTVLPCGPCFLEMGDLKKQSFSEIWNGPAYKKFRRMGSGSEGPKAFGESCECCNCCLVKDNQRVHRYFKWLLPLREFIG